MPVPEAGSTGWLQREPSACRAVCRWATRRLCNNLLRAMMALLAGGNVSTLRPILADIQRSDGEMVVQSKDGSVYGLGLQ